MKNSHLIEYKKNGFIILRKFYPIKKIKKTKKNILELTKKTKKNKLFFFEENKSCLRRIENICEYSKEAEKIINEKKLNKIIFQILGKNSLFKDKLNFKYPGCKGFEPHIDGHFLWKDKNYKFKQGWKNYSNKFMSVVIPLEATDEENGCLQISTLKDTKKILGNSWKEINKKTYPFTPKIKKKYIKKFNFFPVPLKIGDILLFDWKVCHFSKKNMSNKSRMIFYVTFAKNINKKNLKKKYYLDKISSLNPLKNKSLN